MFTRFSNSWELVKESARVLQADKELLVFPIISAIGTIIVSATFVIPMFLANIGSLGFDSRGRELLHLDRADEHPLLDGLRPQAGDLKLSPQPDVG